MFLAFFKEKESQFIFVVINIMTQMLATELVLNPESLIISLIQSNLLNTFYFGIIYILL